MAVHIAILGLVQVMPNGIVKPRVNMTIGEAMTATTEIRVLPDESNSNTDDYPTLKDYLTAEDVSGFKLQHLDQTYVITYN